MDGLISLGPFVIYEDKLAKGLAKYFSIYIFAFMGALKVLFNIRDAAENKSLYYTTDHSALMKWMHRPNTDGSLKAGVTFTMKDESGIWVKYKIRVIRFNFFTQYFLHPGLAGAADGEYSEFCAQVYVFVEKI